MAVRPTVTSRENLLKENLEGRIYVTGNTVIDALDLTLRKFEHNPQMDAELAARYDWVDPSQRLVLVTGHRRENFGDGFKQICTALAKIAQRDDVQVVYPVHLNPQVRDVVMATLSGLPNIHLIEPLDYLDFVWFMRRAYLILTDSGGVQEEAPHLGKPVLVMRDTTERPEAVSAGTVTLVGTRSERIVSAVHGFLDDTEHYQQVARSVNPYGDGHASGRIISALTGRPFDEFEPPLQANHSTFV